MNIPACVGERTEHAHFFGGESSPDTLSTAFLEHMLPECGSLLTKLAEAP